MSLLFFHAERYVGSWQPGYHYRYEDWSRHKRAGRITSHCRIHQALVPYFTQLADDKRDVAAYASRMQKYLDSALRKYAVSYADARNILQSYIDFEDQRNHAHISIVDRTRGLLGILHLGPAGEHTRRFLIDGESSAPVYRRSFPFPSLDPDYAFVHIVWLAYPAAFAILEARNGETPLPLVHGGRVTFSLWSRDIFASPCKPARSFLQGCAALLARLSFIRKRFSGCWLLADSDAKADGNAEYLYRWLMRMHPDRKIFFALDKNSAAWARLEKEGFSLLDLKTLDYFFAWVHCSWLIASDADRHIIRPRWRKQYRDMARHQVCFLRRGSGKDSQPDYSGCHADMLITDCRLEYETLTDNPQYAYMYSRREVQLTGFPRHDELLRKAQAVAKPKTILIMPAWPAAFTVEHVPQSGQDPHTYNAYIKNWLAALQAKTLLAAAREHGYSILFFPYPYGSQHLRDFNLNGVTVPPAGSDIQGILADSALLITDYSHIAADMALIGRCVLYFQCDSRTVFTRTHAYARGLFGDERGGFGDVARTVDDLCARAAELMRQGCRVRERYASRVDACFTFRDQNNCQRVYDAICRLSVPVS